MSRPWTAEEDRKLQWLMSVGAETAQIARFFGRSQLAVCMLMEALFERIKSTEGKHPDLLG